MRMEFPDPAAPGAPMDNVPPGSGGEDFGGSICQTPDGRLFIQAGKTAFWNIEVVGMDGVHALPGGEMEIREGDVRTAERFRADFLQDAAGVKRVKVARAKVAFTGEIDKDFAGAEIVAYGKGEAASARSAAAWDDERLYLAWDVRDGSPWVNAAKAPEQMYVGGDTVDFQLGLDGKADAERAEAVAGDMRLSIGNFGGRATAVLYRPVCEVKKPATFSSGVVKEYRVDFVEVLAGVTIEVKVQPGKGYVVEAAVPLAELGLKPAGGLALRGDFGVTYGGPDGQRTRLRSHWSNQHTGIVDDAVFELKLEPRNWGELRFEP